MQKILDKPSYMKYQGIIFDMGDIFFDATVWRRWLATTLQKLGVKIDYSSLCRQWETQLIDVYLGKAAYWSEFEEFLRIIGLEETRIPEIIKAAKDKAKEVEKRKLFDGINSTLQKLKQYGLKLAVLSDSESTERVVRKRLAGLNIDYLFDVVVTSVDIGYIKPQSEAFAAVLKKLGTKAEETVFVGHDEDELRGAIKSGLTAVAYNNCEIVPSHYCITNFTELTELVRRV